MSTWQGWPLVGIRSWHTPDYTPMEETQKHNSSVCIILSTKAGSLVGRLANATHITEKHHSDFGGHLLWRPIFTRGGYIFILATCVLPVWQNSATFHFFIAQNLLKHGTTHVVIKGYQLLQMILVTLWRWRKKMTSSCHSFQESWRETAKIKHLSSFFPFFLPTWLKAISLRTRRCGNEANEFVRCQCVFAFAHKSVVVSFFPVAIVILLRCVLSAACSRWVKKQLRLQVFFPILCR